MVVVAPIAEQVSAGGIEVTPEMVWAGLEEWSSFDEARDELGSFLVRVYRAMEARRRNPPGSRSPAAGIPGSRTGG
jgi:hypothetical protein